MMFKGVDFAGSPRWKVNYGDGRESSVAASPDEQCFVDSSYMSDPNVCIFSPPVSEGGRIVEVYSQ